MFFLLSFSFSAFLIDLINCFSFDKLLWKLTGKVCRSGHIDSQHNAKMLNW